MVAGVLLTFRVRPGAGAGGGDGVGLGKCEGLAVPAGRDNYIRAVAKREVLRFLTTLDEDQIMGARRTEAGAELTKRISAASDALNSGAQLVFVAIAGVPPPAVQEGATGLAYDSVVSQEVRATSGKRARSVAVTDPLHG